MGLFDWFIRRKKPEEPVEESVEEKPKGKGRKTSEREKTEAIAQEEADGQRGTKGRDSLSCQSVRYAEK
ncbi:MAG: hypothetical protein OEZ48_09175 [Candidatus Bathyarchaeota archaeon]|nr:hypothetical protein [Candidatus Bathyarchaeota archaeon]